MHRERYGNEIVILSSVRLAQVARMPLTGCIDGLLSGIWSDVRVRKVEFKGTVAWQTIKIVRDPKAASLEIPLHRQRSQRRFLT